MEKKLIPRQFLISSSRWVTKEIWDRLKSIYEHSDIASQVFAHRHLVNHSLKEDGNVSTFLEEWQRFYDEASTAGLTFTDAQAIAMLLAALLPSWNPFVTTHGSTQNLTVPILIGRILQEDTT